MTGPLLVEVSGLWSAVSFVSFVSEFGRFLLAMELLLGLAVFPFEEEGLKKALVERHEREDGADFFPGPLPPHTHESTPETEY